MFMFGMLGFFLWSEARLSTTLIAGIRALPLELARESCERFSMERSTFEVREPISAPLFVPCLVISAETKQEGKSLSANISGFYT